MCILTPVVDLNYLKIIIYYTQSVRGEILKKAEEKQNKNNIINQISFGKKIREARTKMGISRASLAEDLGISVNFLGDIERGLKLPSVPNLIMMTNILKVSLDYLFSDSLNNILEEESENIYYTDRQKSVINSIIKLINENF